MASVQEEGTLLLPIPQWSDNTFGAIYRDTLVAQEFIQDFRFDFPIDW